MEQKSSILFKIVQIIGTKQNKSSFFVQFHMTKRVKNKILYQLNFLKSIGYEYTQTIKINDLSNEQTDLPNSLNELENITKNCYLCQLSKYREHVLFGSGNPNANVLFIGDEPSISEDETGSFYSGRAGALLTQMIENVLNVSINDVYITNLVKCKTSHNVVDEEFANSCRAYLLKQIEIIKPKLIVSLGEVSFSYLTNSDDSFSKNRGQVLNYNGLDIIPIYHPSFLLRNPTSKKEAYYDMLKIKSLMEQM